jgi:N-acetylneuraminate synthase/pseudaminic acid synthase
MNILTIKDMIERFSPQGVKVGLSDHSMSNIPAITSVALGATVIEKHFTLDRALGGADAVFSLNPDEFRSLVKDIRDTERTLGKVNYSINEVNRKYARSLYVVKDIKAGEKFTPENIRSIRPSKGLHPKYYEEILGKNAKRDLLFGTPLSLDDIN